MIDIFAIFLLSGCFSPFPSFPVFSFPFFSLSFFFFETAAHTVVQAGIELIARSNIPILLANYGDKENVFT